MSKDLAVAEPKNEVALIFDKINSGLEAFENRKEELTLLKSEAEGLKIESIDDRQGINQVSTIRKKLKKARVDIENEGKAMRDPLTKISKSISAKENELVAIIEPTEKTLLAQEKWVKDEEARIAAEEQRKEDERIQNRVDMLAQFGYGIDLNFLKGLDDEQFGKVVESARAEHEKEEAAKVEKARQEQLQREQDEKDRAELKALREKQEAADKILREREQEIARKEADMKRKEDEDRIMAEKKLEKEMKDARFEPRKAQLLAMGFTTYGIVSYPDFRLQDTWSTYWEQVYNMSDQEWPEYIKDIENAIERRKVRLAEEEKNRAADLEEARQRGIREAKEAEEKRISEEAERVAQASDKDKFAVLVSYLENLPAIEPKSAKHKKLLAEVKDLSAKVIAHIKAKA
jgi:hypothetical protein